MSINLRLEKSPALKVARLFWFIFPPPPSAKADSLLGRLLLAQPHVPGGFYCPSSK
jgi:hypothetical protein